MSFFKRIFGNQTPVTPISVAITSPVSRTVLQRISGAAVFTITGSYSGGAPSSLQARAIPQGSSGVDTGWITITASPSGGTYSGSLTVAQGGWYTLYVRATASNQVAGTATLTRIGVGDVFVVSGQSNSANYGQFVQAATSDLVSSVSLSSAWAACVDPQPSAGNAMGSPWPAFGDAITAHTGLPVAILSTGIGSTSITDWVPGSADYLSNIKPAVQLFLENGFRSFLWLQGESDSTGTTTEATYQTDLRAIIAQSRVDAGWTIPWGIPVTETYDSGVPSNAGPIAAAQTAVAADANNFAGGNTDSITSSTYRYDGVHFTPAGLTTTGQLWAAAVIAALGI